MSYGLGTVKKYFFHRLFSTTSRTVVAQWRRSMFLSLSILHDQSHGHGQSTTSRTAAGRSPVKKEYFFTVYCSQLVMSVSFRVVEIKATKEKIKKNVFACL